MKKSQIKDTVTIQIGNSDNKLTQKRWSEFVEALESLVFHHCIVIHFSGGSNGKLPWQNWCVVAAVDPKLIKKMGAKLVILSKDFEQQSIAVTFGNTMFL